MYKCSNGHVFENAKEEREWHPEVETFEKWYVCPVCREDYEEVHLDFFGNEYIPLDKSYSEKHEHEIRDSVRELFRIFSDGHYTRQLEEIIEDEIENL